MAEASRLSSWRPVHLAVAWAAYWLMLLAIALGPAVPAILRVTGPNGKGSISAGMGDNGIKVSVVDAGTDVWVHEWSVVWVTLALVVPPLLLWALWLSRPRRRAAPPGDVPINQLEGGGTPSHAPGNREHEPARRR